LEYGASVGRAGPGPPAASPEAALRSRAGLLIATGLSEAVRLSGWAAPLSLRAGTAASPAAVAALVRQVEREPELVPGVRRVRVI